MPPKPPTSPFSGMKLSEQVPAGTPVPKLDQRLFEPPPTSPASPVPPARPGRPPTTRPRPTTPPISSSSLETARQLLPASLTATFDLQYRPSYKRSFMLTQEEDEALEDLKLEISRRTDTKVSKEQLVRLAIHALVEDYATKGEHSAAATRVSRRGPQEVPK